VAAVWPQELVMRQLFVAVSALLVLALAPGCGGRSTSSPDAGDGSDGGLDASFGADGIAAARAASDGTGLSLAIRGATITYLKPQIGSATSDPAGFTIQADKPGPALFVAVDPATLTPPGKVGDVVELTITAKATIALQPRAQAITGYTRTATGASIAALTQDLSAATDLVAAIGSYDSEIVSLTATIAEAFSASGAGFQNATIQTSGIAADPNLQIRAPVGLVDALDMVKDCRVTVAGAPFGRFNAKAQLGVFTSSEVTLDGCPAPAVVVAVAQSPTSLRLVFSRNIKASTVQADGSQFTFDHGLTATAAVVTGRAITLTTTPQEVSTLYMAAIAASVTDLQGAAIAAPATASFAGYSTPAVVRINELNANLDTGCDLLELRVISDGTMAGFKLTERTGAVGDGELAFTFPGVGVRKNDFIVVHLSSGSATCNPDAASQETGSPTDQAAAAYAGNFDTAYDFWAADAGLTSTNNVFAIATRAGVIQDAVLISDVATTAVAAASQAAAATVGMVHQWSPAQIAYSDAEFLAAAVDDLDATGTTSTGVSIQRVNDGDTNGKADWTVGAGVASTWGLRNAGQMPLRSGALLSVHTTLGIPSPTSTADANSYLSVKGGYVLSYNSSRKVPNWVAWGLNSSYIGATSRQETFRPDDTLPANLPQAQLSDYSGSGYDRGHMCPSADRTRTTAANSETFYLTNMIPQAANNNQGPWEKLESESRAIAASGKELFIVSGGVFSASPTTVGNGLRVPDATWKVVAVLDTRGQGAAQVTSATRVISVLIPNNNAQVSKNDDWRSYRVSVDSIEAMTGYDVLSDVDPIVQAVVEARVDNL
jgi:endonuclease G, mitochondrial